MARPRARPERPPEPKARLTLRTRRDLEQKALRLRDGRYLIAYSYAQPDPDA